VTKRPLAIVTMVYNEPDFLPLWVRYYAGQAGLANCYVIDHGSDDGGSQGYEGLNVITLPRSPQDDKLRVRIVSEAVTSLLSRYETVIYTDVDEFVFADPRAHESLAAYASAQRQDIVTAYGFELPHVDSRQPAYDPTRLVLAQRRWASFSAAMCKPVLVRRPVHWAPGFHCTDEPVAFGNLLLFHLRWFDVEIANRRLQKTRSQPWASPAAAPWQRWDDAGNRKHFDWYNAMPLIADCAFLPEEEPLKSIAARVLASQQGRENDVYKIDLHIPVEQLWEIPAAFRQLF